MNESNVKQEFDTAKADAFAGDMIDTLNKAALSLMTSLGHRSGLFDVMRALPASTSTEIARAAHLNERYVREWLGAMVTSRVVTIDSERHLFSLPREHAAFLTREAASKNIAVFTQYIALMGAVEDDILTCFKEGGGVPYSGFPRFHAVMAEDSGQSVLSSLESHILPLVPGLADLLRSGVKMLDVGCGAGRVILRLAELFPKSHFTGIDLSQEAVNTARNEASAKRIVNVEFIVQDLSDFDRTAPATAYDFITTFDAIHDQAQPLNVLNGIYRALRSDGTYLMQDISGTSHMHEDIKHPIGTFLYTISCMHCMTVSLAQGGEGLGAMWGEANTRGYLEKAGFRSVQTNKLSHDIQNNWYVVRK